MKWKWLKGAITTIAALVLVICAGKYLDAEIVADETLPATTSGLAQTSSQPAADVTSVSAETTTTEIQVTVNNPVVKKGYVKKKPSLKWKKNKKAPVQS